MDDLLTVKQTQFNAAMERFERNPAYRRTGGVVSFANVSLQAVTAALAFRYTIGPINQALTFAAAYVLADFVNGWVHLYMDNWDDYESPGGPFIAAFHLHHRTPRYKQSPIALVYYHESGSKLWLAVVQLGIVFGIWAGVITGAFAYGALYFSVLSSVAEVSHYLCHVRQTKLGKLLGRARIVMSSRYHARHHRQDNVQYAFLNGMTDPLLNLIARRYYAGYKTTTDTHYALYVGADTTNRA